MTDAVLLTIDDGIASIRFNRPDKLNVLSVDLATAFRDVVKQALSAPSVRVIEVSGQGRAFMAGGDLMHFMGSDDRGGAARELIDPVNEALTLLSEAPQITIAALHGPIAGAGMSIALCLDLAIAADSAVFHYAYSSVAAPPDCGGSWALPRLVGWRTAMDIALFGAPIPAARALQLGLVSRVVPDAELLAETRRMSDRIKTIAPLALGKTKRLFRTSLQNDLPTQLAAEADAFAACAGTDAFEAAIDGFFQRGKTKAKRSHAPEGAKPDD